MDNTFLQNKNTQAEEVKPESFMYDYRFTSPADIRTVTINHLSKLETELHTLRMAFIANGRNPDLMIGQDRRLGTEMEKLEESIKELSMYFRTILAPQ